MREWREVIIWLVGICLVVGTGLVSNAQDASADDPHSKISFARHIQPILQSNCAKCHAGGNSKGHFSFDTRESMLAKEAAIVPGDSAASRLIELVRGDDPLLTMPKDGDQLSKEEIALLAMWIDQGANWDIDRFEMTSRMTHVEPRSPEIPATHDGITHPIDLILDAYFNKYDIKPTPRISDAAFCRRIHLDLVGLLPSTDTLLLFVNDIRPNKRERLVDELLAQNNAYAEHWLTFWNDLLRNDYTGTGYIDGGRTQITEWLYESLRDNKPYDQFVSELVNPNDRSKGFASGIKWRGDVNASQRRELQYAQNVCQVFLGINMKCASCHDSFINSWKLTDSYGVAAIIANQPLELHRCDVPTGVFATPAFVFPEIGQIDADATREDRLAQFAELMTSPENGRLSRTIVNRIWARFMGRGLVKPVDEMTNSAWSEDLLDHLASYLVKREYDTKTLIRLIVTSRAYQSDSISENTNTPRTESRVNGFVFRGPSPQRMTAEQFVDAVWMLTNTAPEQVHARVGSPGRASLSTADRLMIVLGRPMREHVVTTRPNELTTLQALELTNGEIMSGLLARGATALIDRFDQTDDLIRWTYRATLARNPSNEEIALSRELIGDAPMQNGVADFLWSIIMLPEFQLVR